MDNPEKWVEVADTGPLEEVAKLKAFLERTIKGQPKAINSVCKIYEYDLTLRWLEKRQGPLGTFMFLGPSGVGKTELCRMLSLYFMGSVDAMVKIDCSAFNQPHMIHSLIGAPHGFLGYNDKPILSMEKIMSRFKYKKPSEPSAEEVIQELKEEIVSKIKNLRSKLKNLEWDFSVRVEFIQGLEDYHRILHGSDDGQLSMAEFFKDEEARIPIIEMLNPKCVETLENSLTDPTEDVAMLLGLISELRQLYLYHKEAEIEVINLRQQLVALSKKAIAGQNIKPDTKTDQESSPHLVLLFDEIEKGDQALHNLLLQIMEDGRLTLANGDITDLSNAFIVMTSNVGASAISGLLKDKGIGYKIDKQKGRLSEEDNSFEDLERRILKVAEKEMNRAFSSAFRGRIDEIDVFRPLERQDLNDILDYHIEIFAQALGLLEIDFIVDQEAKDIIIAQSLHRPEVGARLLEHKFKSLIKIPLGHRLTGKGDLKGTIRVSVGNNKKIKFFIEKKLSNKPR